jgi:hypothetical protein
MSYQIVCSDKNLPAGTVISVNNKFYRIISSGTLQDFNAPDAPLPMPQQQQPPSVETLETVEQRLLQYLLTTQFAWVVNEYGDLFTKPDSVVAFAGMQMFDLKHLFRVGRLVFVPRLLRAVRAFQCEHCAEKKNIFVWKDGDYGNPCDVPTCWRVKYKELYGRNYVNPQ